MSRTYHFQMNIFVPLPQQHETIAWALHRFGDDAIMNKIEHDHGEFEVELEYDLTLTGGQSEREYIKEVGDGLRDLLKRDVRIDLQYFCFDHIPYEELSYHGKGADSKEPTGDIKFGVTDIIYRTRTVRMPSKCPCCARDLTEKGAVRAVEFNAVDTFIQADMDDNNLNWDDAQQDRGTEDGTEYLVFVACRKCDYVFGQATETSVEEDSSFFKGLRSDEEAATLKG